MFMLTIFFRLLCTFHIKYSNLCVLRVYTYSTNTFHVSVGTVGHRFTRLKATKHACNRAEVKLVKQLGGTSPSITYCTLVARADVERYCEKYEGNNGARINRNTACSSKPDKSKKRIAKQGLKEIETVVTGQEIKKDNPSFGIGNARKKSTLKPILPVELSTLDTNTSIIKQNTQDASKKRKRRTQFELLQSYTFYSDVTEDENHKRKKSSVSDGDDQQLKTDSIMSVDINSNIIDDQNKSPKELEEAKFDYDSLDLPYSDDNNNSSGLIEPRSPTLLLKRSQNNKWHVAKAILPHLSFDDTESEKISDTVIEAKDSRNSGESKPAMTKVKNKVKAPRKSPSSTSKEPSGKKTKMDEGVRPLASIRKVGKKGLKKVNESNKKQKISASPVDGQEKTTKLEDMTDKDITVAKSDNSENNSVSIKDLDGRKSSLLLKDSTESLNKASVVNKEKRENSTKSDNKVVKKKRTRRVEMNTFRLIETIPYPSLLVVKDGELCPSYTMAYNEKNYLPGCCHALWRWRLGKPLKMPSQSPVKTKDDPSLVEKKQDDVSPDKTREDYKFPPNGKQDDNSQDETRPDKKAPVGKDQHEHSQDETRPDKEAPVEKEQDEQPQDETRPDKEAPVEKDQHEHSQVETRPDKAPVEKEQDEQSQVETRPGKAPVGKDQHEHSQDATRPGENSPDKANKDEQFALEVKQADLSSVELQQDEHSPTKEKHDDLSPIGTTQDEQARAEKLRG